MEWAGFGSSYRFELRSAPGTVLLRWAGVSESSSQSCDRDEDGECHWANLVPTFSCTKFANILFTKRCHVDRPKVREQTVLGGEVENMFKQANLPQTLDKNNGY